MKLISFFHECKLETPKRDKLLLKKLIYVIKFRRKDQKIKKVKKFE